MTHMALGDILPGPATIWCSERFAHGRGLFNQHLNHKERVFEVLVIATHMEASNTELVGFISKLIHHTINGVNFTSQLCLVCHPKGLDNIFVRWAPEIAHLLCRHHKAKKRHWQFGLKLDGVEEMLQDLFKQLVRNKVAVEKEAMSDDSIGAFGH